MMRNIFIFLVLVVFAAGCATAHRMNSVQLGMTKQEVITAIGNPASTSATKGVEYMNYRFSETDDHAFLGITTLYFVRLIDGKVDAYGRTGDFDSTKIPEHKTTIDLNIDEKGK